MTTVETDLTSPASTVISLRQIKRANGMANDNLQMYYITNSKLI